MTLPPCTMCAAKCLPRSECRGHACPQGGDATRLQSKAEPRASGQAERQGHQQSRQRLQQMAERRAATGRTKSLGMKRAGQLRQHDGQPT